MTNGSYPVFYNSKLYQVLAEVEDAHATKRLIVYDEEHWAEYRQRAASSSDLTKISESTDAILTAVERAK